MSATPAADPPLDTGDCASAAVRAWVALYTRRLPAELAAVRRELIEADLWDEPARPNRSATSRASHDSAGVD